LLVTFATMKKWLTYIASLAVIAVFLVSSTGISFTIHHCDTTHKDHLVFFSDNYKCETETKAEVEKPQASCCCAKHEAENAQKSENKISKSTCCNNTYKYIKFSFQFDKVLSVIKLIASESPYFYTSKIITVNTFDIADNHQLYHPPPPKLAGKTLLFFIQNIKIPSTPLI
jgi:hypothetical protein